jgi:cellulose synthase/poly-beta-1,6-N-acetylglucosamine synthase-like glycosyltransferase
VTTAWAVSLLVVGLGVAVYAYMVYPALLKGVSLLRPRRPGVQALSEWPLITITVPAYNEERAIASTLEALLAVDYPADRRQILVVSDASADRTDDIVRGFAGRGVELLRMPVRGGKTAAENAAQSLLRGDIIVNTDASVRIAPDALKPLIARFADPEVGLASGRDVSVADAGADRNRGESGYVGYEMWVRDLETQVDSIVGASGCFYAIRRALHLSHVPAGLSRDFASALITREHGYRAVTVNEAVCFVPRLGSLRREYRRKVRTMTRGLQTLWYKRQLLDPFRFGQFAWMLASHKLVRWLAPWGFVLAVAGWLLLTVPEWWVAGAAAVAVAAGLAVAGWYWPEDRHAPRLVATAAYGVFGTIAALEAWLRALRGERHSVWEPTRRPSAGPV